MSTIRGRGPDPRWIGLCLVAVMLVAAGCSEVSPQDSPVSTPGATAATSATSEAAQPEAAQPRLDQPQVAEAEIDFRAGIDAATDFAAEQGLTVSIAVIDRSADAEVVNGAAADTPVFGASLVKLFLADNLLHRQRAGEFQLGPRDRELLEAMLVASDDPAADSLYSRFGGDAMVTEVARRYQLPSVAPTNQAGEWELTTMSARDVARYYDRLLTRTPAADRDYLIDLLRRSAMIARDGFDQFFGIPAALPEQTWAIKQGWMCCPRDTSYLHTTAIIGADNRYTVAILSGDPGVTSPGFSTDALNRIAAILFPPGAVTD
ncbi:MAG: class A beta-lactamase-related serine hydrolase [Actinomycetota bacterium]|nr:class A beta-lactamase-related serine hydrolase [Actinomycetota bacterium]